MPLTEPLRARVCWPDLMQLGAMIGQTNTHGKRVGWLVQVARSGGRGR